MNIYRLTRKGPGAFGTYSACVVVAESVGAAKYIHPEYDAPPAWFLSKAHVHRWAKPENVRVRLLGVADPRFKVPGVILNSYVAG